MVKLEQLIPLEKNPCIEPEACIVRFDRTDTKTGTRQRILETECGRIYYHEMSGNDVVKAFELALDWIPFGKYYVYAYTPDDRHICQIEVRERLFFDILPLKCKQIQPGDSCAHDGFALVYEDRNHIRLNDIRIPVVENSEYVYSLRRDGIHAMNAASGLFCFLENISARKQMGKYPIFHDVWRMIAKRYGVAQKEVAA